MSFESSALENIPQPIVTIEKDVEEFVPQEFRADPFGYFEEKGKNIKSGEIQRDEDGSLKEDPTATKDLPVWENATGERLAVVGKKVNTTKSQIGKSNDPFYEYNIMEIAREFDLPAPRPIAKVSSEQEHLIIMEKIDGIRWTAEGMRSITDSDLTQEDKEDLMIQAKTAMDVLKDRYRAIGLERDWKVKDMVFGVDIPNRRVVSVTPTDWERTKINRDQLQMARSLHPQQHPLK